MSHQAGLCFGQTSEHPEEYVLGDLLARNKHKLNTRSASSGILPPQETQGTLISSMTRIWNVLPQEIKEEKSMAIFKKKIKEHWNNISRVILSENVCDRM